MKHRGETIALDSGPGSHTSWNLCSRILSTCISSALEILDLNLACEAPRATDHRNLTIHCEAIVRQQHKYLFDCFLHLNSFLTKVQKEEEEGTTEEERKGPRVGRWRQFIITWLWDSNILTQQQLLCDDRSMCKKHCETDYETDDESSINYCPRGEQSLANWTTISYQTPQNCSIQNQMPLFVRRMELLSKLLWDRIVRQVVRLCPICWHEFATYCETPA